VLLRVLPVVVAIGLLVFCLIDCAQSPDRVIRTIPKWAWMFVIVALPVVGPLGWLIAGRPHRGRHGKPPRGPGSSARPQRSGSDASGPIALPGPLGPDDDPEFLDRLRREQERRRQQQPPTDGDVPE